MTTHYEPIFLSAQLPPVPMPAPQFVKPKTHRASIYRAGTPISLSALSAAGHTHALALYGKSTRSLWRLESSSTDAATLLPLTRDIPQHWRIIDTATHLITHEG